MNEGRPGADHGSDANSQRGDAIDQLCVRDHLNPSTTIGLGHRFVTIMGMLGGRAWHGNNAKRSG